MQSASSFGCGLVLGALLGVMAGALGLLCLLVFVLAAAAA